MTREEIKCIVDEVIKTDSMIDLFEQTQATVYTNSWIIEMEELLKMQEKGVRTLSISSEGGKITLVVKH